MSEEGLDDLALFARLVELRSLSAAARALHLPKSSPTPSSPSRSS